MTIYKMDCHKCTYAYVSGIGDEWCKATVDGHKVPVLSEDTAGTKEDPDIFTCPFYTTEERQMELYPWSSGKGDR